MTRNYQNFIWQLEDLCQKYCLLKNTKLDLKEKVLNSGFYDQVSFLSKNMTGFWLEEEFGNNQFEFKKGKKLFVPPLVFTDKIDLLKSGNQVVFRDLDENGNLIEVSGLENFIFSQGKQTGLPFYIVDNHNWVFYAWMEAIQMGLIQKNAFLVHIDAHKDEAKFLLNKKFVQYDLSSVRDFVTHLKVSDYISAAQQVGLISSEFLSITATKDFEDYASQFALLKKSGQNIILNVDLDIFAPEMSLIFLEEKIQTIGYFISQADLITFATSPGFIDQNLAIEIVKIFFKHL